MATELSGTPPDAMPAHQNTPRDGLGYSRHYAKRIREIGKSSKDSWILRLWNQMFPKKMAAQEAENIRSDFHVQISSSTIHKKEAGTRQPEQVIVAYRSRDQLSRQPGAAKDSMTQRLPPWNSTTSGGKPKVLAAELANSPYMATLPRSTYRLEKTRSSAPAVGGGDVKDVKDPVYRRKESYSPQKDYYAATRRTAHPYLSSNLHSWRPRESRSPSVIQLEKRAKATVEKAVTNGTKIFTCECFYPVDAYIRFSMRKRGWVEKFGQRANTSRPVRNTSSKLECVLDEDFEAICDQDIPAPWVEEFGVYAMMSRLIRHHPVKFIWGGINVNNLTLRSDVIVNHFTKSRSFSSKIGLTLSLRELPWVNSRDQNTFYPRSYLLSEDEKDAIKEDFRLTACLCLLKWLRAQQQPVTTRQDTKLDAPPGGTAMDQEARTPNNNFDHNFNYTREPTGLTVVHREDDDEDALNNNTDDRLERNRSDVSETQAGHATPTPEEVREVDDIRQRLATVDVGGADDGEDADEDELQDTTKVEYNPSGEPKVLPNIAASRQKKEGGEVPIQAVVWALQHVKHFLRGKAHDDIDLTGRQGLTRTQWSQLMPFIYKVVQDGARIVGVTEGILRETEEVLDKAKECLPQFEIDGLRNIWIVKPGNKSKGIGIEFLDTLESLMKYASNSTTQGTYVMQKYIEHPLLIHRVKFDIRQWFLVTEWNPLTVWFYKDSYLRLCSQEYDYDTKHESVHLSNVAIQQNYLNGKRSSELPDNNFLTSEDFKQYLCMIGEVTTWDDLTYPAMKDAVVNTLLTTLDVPETRKNAFELYGADFILSQDMKPWLLEVNSSPGMAPTSKEKARLCAGVIDDVIRVVLDRKEDKNCDTGRFELILRDVPVPQVKSVDTKFVLDGQRIRKADLQRYAIIDTKLAKEERMDEVREANRRTKEEEQRKKQEEERVQKQQEVETRIRQAREFEEARQRKEEEEDDDEEDNDDEEFWGKDDAKSGAKDREPSDQEKDPHWTTILNKTVPIQSTGY